MGPAWLNFGEFIGDYLPTGPWRFEIIILKEEVSEGKLEYGRELEQYANSIWFSNDIAVLLCSEYSKVIWSLFPLC